MFIIILVSKSPGCPDDLAFDLSNTASLMMANRKVQNIYKQLN